MFTSCSHFQINGGNFVSTGGDFNVQSNQPAGSIDEMLTGLESRVGPDAGRRLLGVERTEREGSARKAPYGAFGDISQCICPDICSTDPSHRRLVESKLAGEGADTIRPTATTRRSHLDPSIGPISSGLRPRERLLPKSPLPPNGNQNLQSKSHSADVHPDSTQPSGYVNVETQPATNNSAFPWNRPLNTPATNINGGTFIGGNMNNFQRNGEAGEF